MPAWKNPCCWVSSGGNGRAIWTRPGSTRSRRAPISAIAPWRAKLARVRLSKSGSAGTNTPLASEGGDLGQGEAVEVARVSGGVGAGVLDEDEVAVLQVRREQLLAHHDVDRVARRPGDVPGHRLAVAGGIDVVAQPLGRLDDAAEHAGVPVHPALVVARRRPDHAADEVARVGDEVAPRLGDHLDLGAEIAQLLVDELG